MALPASLREVGGVDHGARVARRENVMYTMARAAVRRGKRSLAQRQAVIAVRVGRHAIRWKPISRSEPGVSMASRASLRGNVCRTECRCRIFGIQNQMLAVAVRAIRRITRAVPQRCAVHTFVELSGDLFVTLGASSNDVPVADFRLRLPRGQNS